MIKYRQGSLAAFELLYSRHKDATYRYFLRQCSGQAIAEDLLQELWSKVIKSKNSYQEQAQFTTWLYTVAHNLVVDHQRKLHVVEQHDEQSQLSLDAQPDAQLEQQQLAKKLKHCLNKLPSAQLETFLLNQETDLTLAQIAQVVCASLEATKSRLRYAISALRQCLSLSREG